MADAVRAHCGIWVAPVVPGYDARELGGQRVVPRRDGATLRASWEAAIATVPDALGVISWNEFSENTHVEPSTRFGDRYLQVLAELTGAPTPAGALDSSDPQAAGSPVRAVVAFGAGVAVVVLAAVVGRRRRRTERR
jgi:MYXO-CTERM domain-containing protein